MAKMIIIGISFFTSGFWAILIWLITFLITHDEYKADVAAVIAWFLSMFFSILALCLARTAPDDRELL